MSLQAGADDRPIAGKLVRVDDGSLILRSQGDGDTFAVPASDVRELRATLGSYWVAGFVVGAVLDAVVTAIVVSQVQSFSATNGFSPRGPL